MTNNSKINDWRDLIQLLEDETEWAGLGVFDLDGKLLDANETMCVFLGTTTEELQPLNHIINPDFLKLKELDPINEKIFDGLLTVSNYFDLNFGLKSKIFKRDDAIFVYALADVKDMFKENSELSKLNQEVSNLQRQLHKEKTKLERTLAELRETQQMLIQSEKMNALGQMVAGVAHEINNPIAFVTNNLYELEKYTNEMFKAFSEMENKFSSSGAEKSEQIIAEIKEKHEVDYLTEDISDILHDSKNGVERVKNIVADLRKFSRLDESDIKHIDLVESIKSTLSIVQAEIDKKQIEFCITTPNAVHIDCFPGQLNQAILNILLNAIYAVNKKGKIELKIKEEAKTLIISISDNGCGIPADALEKIFNPFYTTKPVGSGTGLGLSITYKIITDLHKAKIDVRSEPEKGSIFIITLPTVITN